MPDHEKHGAISDETEQRLDRAHPDELPMHDMDEIFAELEAEGLIRRNGKFRRSPITGKLKPVYVVTELGRAAALNVAWPEGEQ